LNGEGTTPDIVALRHDRLRLAAPAVQHEINNALMVLASNLEMLRRSVAEGAPRRQLDRAIDSMRRLETGVRGYLDAARRPAEDPGEAVPTKAVQQVLPLLVIVLGGRFGFDLLPTEGAALPEVRLDRARLDLGLLSLVREAAGTMVSGARIVVRGELRPSGEVALLIALPPGAVPSAETAQLLDEAASCGGGRLEWSADGGVALVWPAKATPPSRGR